MSKQIENLFYKEKKKILICLYILLFLYLCLMIWEVFIGPYRTYSGEKRYNLYPFKTVMEFLLNATKYSFKVIFINLIANIITFIPLGFLITLLFRRTFKLINIALCCTLIIICIELGQFILNVGVFDIDDIILNTVGCLLGFMTYKIVRKIF